MESNSLSDEISKRFGIAQKRKTNWCVTYKEALSYAAPQRENFDNSESGVRKDNTDRVFDSTAQSALIKFASNLQSSLVPPMKKWVNLVAGQQIEDEQKEEANKQLSNIRESVFSAIHNSNFDTQVSESFLDLGIGSGALLVLKGDAKVPLRFISVPLDQLFLEEGAKGIVDTAFRKHSIVGRNIKATWADATISADLQRIIEDKPEGHISFVEATLKAKIKKKIVVGDKVELVEVEGYKYVVLAEKNKEVIVEREQESSPWIIFRWNVLPGEVYGRGPVLSALADIKTLNKTKELILKNASLAVSGAFTAVDDGIINIENIQIAPGAIIPVMSNPGAINGPTLAPLPTGSNFNVAQLVIADLKRSINDMMFIDPLGPLDLPVKTATEISLRQQELSKRIGSAFGRLQYELISPLIDRILFVLEEMGIVELEGFKVDGRIIAIEHISPLAMAQDQEELTSMLRYAETLAGIFGPQSVLGLIKPDKFARKTAELLNIPQDIVPTEEEFKVMKDQLAQMAAQEQQATGYSYEEAK